MTRYIFISILIHHVAVFVRERFVDLHPQKTFGSAKRTPFRQMLPPKEGIA